MLHATATFVLDKAQLHTQVAVAGLVALGMVLSLLVWRLLVFTVFPSYFPREPKNLPYWIPCESTPSKGPFSQLEH